MCGWDSLDCCRKVHVHVHVCVCACVGGWVRKGEGVGECGSDSDCVGGCGCNCVGEEGSV